MVDSAFHAHAKHVCADIVHLNTTSTSREGILLLFLPDILQMFLCGNLLSPLLNAILEGTLMKPLLEGSIHVKTPNKRAEHEYKHECRPHGRLEA
jgi:hypothetical protein